MNPFSVYDFKHIHHKPNSTQYPNKTNKQTEPNWKRKISMTLQKFDKMQGKKR